MTTREVSKAESLMQNGFNWLKRDPGDVLYAFRLNPDEPEHTESTVQRRTQHEIH